MKRMELASTACAATVLRRCKHLVRIVLWLGLLLGINATCLSGELLPSILMLTTDEVDEVDEHCQKLLDEVPISQITVDIRPRDLEGHVVDEEALPDDCSGFFSIPAVYASSDLLMARGRGLLRCWRGAQFCHYPLYFEDIGLERWGACHSSLQPAISGIKFFGTALLLTVKMWHKSPHSYVRTPPCF